MDQALGIPQVGRIWETLQGKLVSVFPNVLVALGVLLLGVVVAFVVRALLRRLIQGLHLVLERHGFVGSVSGNAFVPASEWLSAIVFWILVLFAFTVATEVVGLSVVTAWLGGLTTYLPKVLGAASFIFVGVITGNILKEVVRKAASSAGVLYANALGRLTHITIVLVTAVIAAGQVGIDVHFLTTLIVVLLAALVLSAALAFGLGARPIVTNILSSYYLKKRYQVGQSIQIGDIEGKISEITPTAVIVENAEGRTLIPCKQFTEMKSTLLAVG